jgi:hypothetical protein
MSQNNRWVSRNILTYESIRKEKNNIALLYILQLNTFMYEWKFVMQINSFIIGDWSQTVFQYLAHKISSHWFITGTKINANPAATLAYHLISFFLPCIVDITL